jgi:hypothetical protein
MSYSSQVIFHGDHYTPQSQRSLQYDDFVLHQDGEITIDTCQYARHDAIDITSRKHRIYRDEHSDIIYVARDNKQVLVLQYCRIGAFDGEWRRLIPHGSDPLSFVTPSPAKRLFWSTLEFAFGIVDIVFLLLQSAADGWNHTNRTRR